MDVGEIKLHIFIYNIRATQRQVIFDSCRGKQIKNNLPAFINGAFTIVPARPKDKALI